MDIKQSTATMPALREGESVLPPPSDDEHAGRKKWFETSFQMVNVGAL